MQMEFDNHGLPSWVWVVVLEIMVALCTIEQQNTHRQCAVKPNTQWVLQSDCGATYHHQQTHVDRRNMRIVRQGLLFRMDSENNKSKRQELFEWQFVVFLTGLMQLILFYLHSFIFQLSFHGVQCVSHRDHFSSS